MPFFDLPPAFELVLTVSLFSGFRYEHFAMLIAILVVLYAQPVPNLCFFACDDC